MLIPLRMLLSASVLGKRGEIPPCCESGSLIALRFSRQRKILNVSQRIHLRFFSAAKIKYQSNLPFLATGRFCLASLALTILCGIHRAYAQDIQSELSQQVGELNERYKPEDDSEAQQRRLRAGERFGEIENSVEVSERTSIRDPRFEVLSHQRGIEGLPFPDPSEVILEPSSSVPVEADAQQPQEYWVAPRQKVTRPPSCGEGRTYTVQRREKGAVAELIFDRLYLSQKLMPLDTSDIYGAQTAVEIYDGDSAARVSILMEADAVPCLPYRVRFTDTHAFYHLGADALANYDKDPTRRGETHPWVRKKIEAGALR